MSRSTHFVNCEPSIGILMVNMVICSHWRFSIFPPHFSWNLANLANLAQTVSC
jgi:hypothetical protein